MKWKKDHKAPNTKAKLTVTKSDGSKKSNKSSAAGLDRDDVEYDESGSENLSDDESNFDEEEDDEDDEEESLEKFNPNFNQLNMNMKNKPLMI